MPVLTESPTPFSVPSLAPSAAGRAVARLTDIATEGGNLLDAKSYMDNMDTDLRNRIAAIGEAHGLTPSQTALLALLAQSRVFTQTDDEARLLHGALTVLGGWNPGPTGEVRRFSEYGAGWIATSRSQQPTDAPPRVVGPHEYRLSTDENRSIVTWIGVLQANPQNFDEVIAKTPMIEIGGIDNTWIPLVAFGSDRVDYPGYRYQIQGYDAVSGASGTARTPRYSKRVGANPEHQYQSFGIWEDDSFAVDTEGTGAAWFTGAAANAIDPDIQRETAEFQIPHAREDDVTLHIRSVAQGDDGSWSVNNDAVTQTVTIRSGQSTVERDDGSPLHESTFAASDDTNSHNFTIKAWWRSATGTDKRGILTLEVEGFPGNSDPNLQVIASAQVHETLTLPRSDQTYELTGTAIDTSVDRWAQGMPFAIQIDNSGSTAQIRIAMIPFEGSSVVLPFNWDFAMAIPSNRYLENIRFFGGDGFSPGNSVNPLNNLFTRRAEAIANTDGSAKNANSLANLVRHWLTGDGLPNIVPYGISTHVNLPLGAQIDGHNILATNSEVHDELISRRNISSDTERTDIAMTFPFKSNGTDRYNMNDYEYLIWEVTFGHNTPEAGVTPTDPGDIYGGGNMTWPVKKVHGRSSATYGRTMVIQGLATPGLGTHVIDYDTHEQIILIKPAAIQKLKANHQTQVNTARDNPHRPQHVFWTLWGVRNFNA